MLAQLCLTPRESRATFINQHLSTPMFSSHDTTGFRVKIATLFRQDAPPTPETILLTMGADTETIISHSTLTLPEFNWHNLGYENFKSLDEASWVRLASICDQSESETPHALLYKIAEHLALDTTATSASRIHAYLFLRSQNQQISSPISFVSRFAEFFIAEVNNAQTLAVLLLDPFFPSNGLASLREDTKEHVILFFSALIEWAQANTHRDNLLMFLQQFALLESPLITMQLIECGFTDICTFEELRSLFSTPKAIEWQGEILFNVFFLKQMLRQYIARGQIIINDALKNFNDMPDLQNLEITNQVFTLFIAPALKEHPCYLPSTGQNILENYPQLLDAFTQLIPEMTLDTENFDLIMRIIHQINATYTLNTQEKLRSIFSVLTTANDYTGLEDKIMQLLNDKNFHIEKYYAAASPTFKQLPDVVIAMQLYCYFNECTDKALVEIAWENSEQLHENLKQLPLAELRKKNENPHYAAFTLIYRITKNERINNTDKSMELLERSMKKGLKIISTGSSLCGKEAKTPFLCSIVKYLIQPQLERYRTDALENTTNSSSLSFIQTAYQEAYVSIIATKDTSMKSTKNMEDWLKIILDKPDVPETKTLLSLPNDLRQVIFNGSNIESETLLLITPAKRPSLISSIWSSDSASTTTASATSVTPNTESNLGDSIFRRPSTNGSQSKKTPTISAGNTAGNG